MANISEACGEVTYSFHKSDKETVVKFIRELTGITEEWGYDLNFDISEDTYINSNVDLDLRKYNLNDAEIEDYVSLGGVFAGNGRWVIVNNFNWLCQPNIDKLNKILKDEGYPTTHDVIKISKLDNYRKIHDELNSYMKSLHTITKYVEKNNLHDYIDQYIRRVDLVDEEILDLYMKYSDLLKYPLIISVDYTDFEPGVDALYTGFYRFVIQSNRNDIHYPIAFESINDSNDNMVINVTNLMKYLYYDLESAIMNAGGWDMHDLRVHSAIRHKIEEKLGHYIKDSYFIIEIYENLLKKKGLTRNDYFSEYVVDGVIETIIDIDEIAEEYIKNIKK